MSQTQQPTVRFTSDLRQILKSDVNLTVPKSDGAIAFGQAVSGVAGASGQAVGGGCGVGLVLGEITADQGFGFVVCVCAAGVRVGGVINYAG